VADEFPTLEVALAVCVLWLAWRGWVLARGAARLESDTEALAAAIRRGEEPGAAARRGSELGWLGHLAREALAAARDPGTAEPGHDPVRERTVRIRRRLRSAAARDLLVCAVLIGALAYARAANLGVSGAFFVLGGLSGALLLVAVGLRLWLDRRVESASQRLAHASGVQSSRTSVSARQACPTCGKSELVSVKGRRYLGRKLHSLGVDEVLVCVECGHLTGRVVKR
jgi:hypothetical protein